MRAWKIALFGLGGLLAAAVVANLVNPQRRAPTPATINVSQMMSKEEALNEQCRGGSGDDPKTSVACDQRDHLIARLEAAGTCWGNPSDPNQVGADKTWQPCKSESAKEEKPLNPRGASTLYKLAHPDEGVRYAETDRAAISPELGDGHPSTQIQYDPISAQKTARADAAMRATRGCLRGQAAATVRLGLRNRDEVAERIAASCRHPLTFVGLFSDAEITAFTKTMAYDAISDLEGANR